MSSLHGVGFEMVTSSNFVKWRIRVFMTAVIVVKLGLWNSHIHMTSMHGVEFAIVTSSPLSSDMLSDG